MNKQKGFTAVEMIWVVYGSLFVAGVIGWVLNIIDIVGSDFSAVDGILILRIIGVIVAPLGAVLGYF